MKQMTEAELRQLLSDAWDDGFDTGVREGNSYDPDQMDIERDEHVDSVMESI